MGQWLFRNPNAKTEPLKAIVSKLLPSRIIDEVTFGIEMDAPDSARELIAKLIEAADEHYPGVVTHGEHVLQDRPHSTQRLRFNISPLDQRDDVIEVMLSKLQGEGMIKAQDTIACAKRVLHVNQRDKGQRAR